MSRVKALCARAVYWCSLVAVLMALGCASARPIPDDALLPLPDTLTLEGSGDDGCGMGNDAECGRRFLVSAPSAQSSSDAAALVARHLEEAEGYDLSLQEDGAFVGQFVGCRDRRHCVWVAPFSESLYETRNETPSEWAERYGLTESQLRTLEQRGAAVDFSDCC